MAELTADQLTAKIAAIDAKIDSIIADPDSIADYTWGEKSVSVSQVLRGLKETREMYQELLKNSASSSFGRSANDEDRYGNDVSDYLGS